MMQVLALLLVFVISAGILAVSILGPALRVYRGGASPVIALSTGLVTSALAAWCCFFAFVIGPAHGVVFQLLMLAVLGHLARKERHALASKVVRAEMVVPVLGAFVIGGGLLLLAFGATDPDSYLTLATTRYSHQLPNDNMIPFIFAEMLRDGILRSPMIGDWLSSDRPPLQTGMVLLYGAPFIAGDSVLVYQVISTLAQTWALIGLFILIRALGGDFRVAVSGMIVLAASPLFLIHSVYVWPKLLPAGLLCVTAAVFFTPNLKQGGGTAMIGSLAGVAAALSMGAHGATAFALVGFALAALILHRFPPVAFTGFGLLTFGVTYLPWTLYQHFIDPPGNRLLKWHIGGSIPIDDRGVLETLLTQLREVSVTDWLYGRIQNLDRIISDPLTRLKDGFLIPFADDPMAMGAHLRAMDFFHWSSGLGILAPVILLLPVAVMLKSVRPLVVACVCSLGVWAVLIFEPGGAITHQGSFVPQLVAMAIALFVLGRLNWRIVAAVAGLQALSTAMVYFVFN